MQLNAKHAIKDEERAEPVEALSTAHKEHQKAEHTKCPQDVYNSTVQERTCFNFVKILLMLQYEESVKHFGHLVKDSTEI